jgi:hypothetical protein
MYKFQLFTLDEIIINYGTPFQKELDFLSLPSPTELLKVHGRESGRNMKLPAHRYILLWLRMRETLLPLPFTSLWLDV